MNDATAKTKSSNAEHQAGHPQENWTRVRLEELLSFVGSGITPRGGSDVYQEVGVKFIRSQNVYAGELRLDEIAHVSDDLHHQMSRTHIETGDVLLNITGASIGRSTTVPPDFGPANVNQHVCILRPKRAIRSKYLSWYLNSPAGQDQIMTTQSGVTRQGLNYGQIRAMELPLAPLAEQKRIVNEIEKQFTRLDAAVAGLKRIQANLERYKASVLKAACEGRLVPQEAELNPDYEPADKLLGCILEERRRKWEEEEWQKHVERAKKKVEQARRKEAGLPYYFRDMEPEDWMDVPEEEYRDYLPTSDKWKEKYEEPDPPDTDDLPVLPEGWVWATVEQIGNVQLGRQRAPKHHEGPYMRPYLRAANATWEGVDLSDVMEMNFPPSDLETYRLEYGDILLNEASGSQDEVGKPFVWENQIPDCCFQNTLIRVRLFSLPPDFIYYHFRKDARTGRFGEVAKGVGIFHLGATRLASIPVAIPPLKEQARIVEELERRLTLVEAAEDTLKSNLQRAARLRQAILQDAFEGKLVPQDPSDEPAAALLARIRGKEEEAVAQPGLPFEQTDAPGP